MNGSESTPFSSFRSVTGVVVTLVEADEVEILILVALGGEKSVPVVLLAISSMTVGSEV
jgi:hypothetical protein